jgi:hypothetical protein
MCLLAKNRKRSGKGERGRVDSLTCAVLILSDLLFPGVINICLASLITSVIARIPLTRFLLQVQRPVNQVLSSMADQEFGHQIENSNLSSVEIHRTDSVDEFEVRIL